MTKLAQPHIDYLQESIANIDYGSIVITIHNGYITQIDVTEKKRFEPSAAKKTPAHVKPLKQIQN